MKLSFKIRRGAGRKDTRDSPQAQVSTWTGDQVENRENSSVQLGIIHSMLVLVLFLYVHCVDLFLIFSFSPEFSYIPAGTRK